MNPTNLSTQRQRIAELARTKPGTALYLLHHVIDLEWMRKAHELTRKDGATGIDGVTAAAYEANLEANLLDLLERIKSGRYRALPVRRAYAKRMARNGRSAFRASRTKWRSGQSPWCWRRSTSRTFAPARTGSAPGARRMTRCACCLM